MEAAVLGSFGAREIKDTGWSGQTINDPKNCSSLVTLVSKGNEDSVKMEPTKFERVVGSALCDTDRVEYIKRLPAGRIHISLTHLTGDSTGLSVQETVKVTGSPESSGGTAVSACELKVHTGSQQLFAVVNDLADLPELNSPEWVNDSHKIRADRDIELDIPTPDYSSPSDEEDEEAVGNTTLKANGSAVGSGVDSNATVTQRQISSTNVGVVSHSNEAVNDISHEEFLPIRLVRQGSIKRRRKKGQPSADAVSLSEPEDMDISRRDKNDETYANGGRPLQNIGISFSLNTTDSTSCVVEMCADLASRILKKQSASDSRRKRLVLKAPTMGSKPTSSVPRPEQGTLLDISFQLDNTGYGFILEGSNTIRIMTVKSGCPADLAGLRPKDILFKINGVDMFGRTHQDAVRALEAELPLIKLSVLRKTAAHADNLGRRVTMGAPLSLMVQNNSKVSIPSSAPECDIRCKDTKIQTLEKMQGKAAEELKRVKTEYRKNPTDSVRQQLKNAQKVLESLTQEITGLTASSTATITADLHLEDKSPQRVTVSHNPSVKESGQRVVYSNFSALKRNTNFLASFLNFIFVNGHDPSAVFFTMTAEEYTNGGSVREMTRWAGEIYATFLASHAPLALSIDSGMLASIKNVLLPKSEKENELNELKSLFLPALHFIQDVVNQLLAVFCEKKVQDHELDSSWRSLLNSEEEQIMGKKNFLNLWKIFEHHLNMKTAHSQALASCIAVFFGQCDVPDLNKYCPGFITSDRKAFWLRYYRKAQVVHSHSLFLLRWFDIANCDTCHEVIWTAFNHGLHCQGCGIFVHKDCTDRMNPLCTGTVRARTNHSRSRSRERLGIFRTNYEPVETQLIKTARRSEVISSVFHVTLPDEETATPSDRIGGEGSDEFQDLKVADTTSIRSTPSNVSATSSKLGTMGGSFASSRRHSEKIDPDMEVEPELPSLEEIIPKEELKKLKQKEKKRQEVINELLYTERVHVCKLKVLYKFFFRPMLKNKLIDTKHLSLLFSNIEDIFNIHRHISDNFKTRRKENAVILRIGDILMKHFAGERGEHMQQGCAKFCRDQSYALETLRNLQRQNAKLAAFLQEAGANPLCGRQQLRDLLLCEMQRLVKYPLLIDSLLKYTQQDTEEYKQLTLVNEHSRELLHYVNEEVREQENWRKTEYVNRRLDRRPIEGSTLPVLIEYKELALTQHRLIHDGKLTWRLSSSKASLVHVMLFDDIIVLLHQQDDKYILRCQSALLVSGREDSRIHHSPIIRLRDLFVKENAADKCALFLISASRDGAQTASQYDLVAKSKEDRKKWFGLISTAIEVYKKQPPGVYIRRLKSDVTSPDSDTSPQVTDKPKLSHSSHSYNSLDLANVLLEIEVPDLIQPSEVTCSVVTENSSSVQGVSESSANMKRRLSSVYSKLNEKRKLFAQTLTVSEDDADSVFERDVSISESWESSELINASVDQVRQLQQMLDGSLAKNSTRVTQEDTGKSSHGRSLARGLLSTSQRSRISRQLQYHENLLLSLDQAGDSERDSLVYDLQESQGQINVLIDSLSSRARSFRQDSYVSAVALSSLESPPSHEAS